jgi:ubiquinone/menaquinone biosynthesis C-methylase UbiE
MIQRAMTGSDPLQSPAVPASVYTEEYYRHHMGPHETWNANEGTQIDGYYVGVLRDRVRLQPGERLVDLGAGRGELLAAAVKAGAGSAVGIEYSEAAVELARKTLRAHEVEHAASIHAGDVRATGLDGGQFDVVTLLDVVEHLTPGEVDQALREAGRLLRPGGRVVVHTLPNRLIYDVTYRLQRLSRPSRRRSWPRNPRTRYEVEMHINEFTLGSLRRSLKRAGLADVEVSRGRWVLEHFQPEEGAKRLYSRLAAHRPTAWLGSADLWGSARRG